MIPSAPKPSGTAYAKQKKHKLFRRRAGIEPVIGHCKSDHRLSKNFYKGLFGDSINVMLAVAAFNFKRVMNLLFCLILNLTNMVLIWMEVSDRKPRTASASCYLWHPLCAESFLGTTMEAVVFAFRGKKTSCSAESTALVARRQPGQGGKRGLPSSKVPRRASRCHPVSRRMAGNASQPRVHNTSK